MNSRESLWNRILIHKYFYLLLMPAFIYYFVFAYIPIYGITLAFKEYSFSKGILGSPWIGSANFKDLFRNFEFWGVCRNTVIISLGKILFLFPCAIGLALLINEVRNTKLKRFFQTVYTFPHFLSWIVIAGITFNMLSDTGLVNQIISVFGGSKTSLLSSSAAFRFILYISNTWKEVGWDTIIYLAVLAGINLELYEAAAIDGASRLQQVRFITWPSLKSIAAILLVLAVGNVMNGGFDQIINMYNPAVYNVGDIIDTYIYRTTFIKGNATFNMSAAVGLFKAVINFALLYIANKSVKLMGEDGLF